jgi:uncharacterized SAM-dependent methyltransferase
MAVVAPEGRLAIREVPPTVPEATFAAEVRSGLAARPKRLPCRFFYDDAGSRLFEQICELPEYYLTRAEQEILTRHADEIAAAVPAGTVLVELGSGSAAKTRRLIEAFLRRQARLRYVPIDISRGALAESARRLLAEYPALEVHGLAADCSCGWAPTWGTSAGRRRRPSWLRCGRRWRRPTGCWSASTCARTAPCSSRRTTTPGA